MSISMKTIFRKPAFEVSKTTSLSGFGKQQMFRGPLGLLLALVLLFSLSTAFGGDNDNPTYLYPKAPPAVPGPGQGVTLVSPPGDAYTQVSGTKSGKPTVPSVVSVPGKGSVTLAILNHEKNNINKHWTLVLLGQPGQNGKASDVQSLTATCEAFTSCADNTAPVENWKGKAPGDTGWVHPNKGNTGPVGTDKMSFQFDIHPQSCWEYAVISNPTDNAISFSVQKNKTKCSESADELLTMFNPQTDANNPTLAMVDMGMFSYPGADAQQAITEIAYLAQDQDMDTNVVPIWNMPADTGFWTWSYTTEYNGISAPHGGVVFTCMSGPGLQPGEMYTVGFPDAGMNYLQISFDSDQQEFQQYVIDLQPNLSITSSSNNSVAVGFNSVLGYHYTLLTSPSLLSSNWHAAQSFAGIGGTITLQTPTVAPVGFFRVACQPAPPVINPPTVIGVSAPANSNAITITFSEPVDPVTATDLNNYFTGGFFGPILIDNISPLGSRAVVLTLDSPLMLSSNYFLGVRGVADLNSNVMAPTSSQFSPFALQTPCPGGTLLARQTYSVCEPDGFWHVVEDDWYDCPPVTKFRVADTKTSQPCNSAQTPPNPVGLLYCTSADVVSSCQSYNTVGPVTVCTGNGGLWQASSYIQDQCVNGTLYLDGPIQTVPMNPPTPCGQTPPLSPAPQ
jgi:hypothetical protein